jgi:hypothetical protein
LARQKKSQADRGIGPPYGVALPTVRGHRCGFSSWPLPVLFSGLTASINWSDTFDRLHELPE